MSFGTENDTSVKRACHVRNAVFPNRIGCSTGGKSSTQRYSSSSISTSRCSTCIHTHTHVHNVIDHCPHDCIHPKARTTEESVDVSEIVFPMTASLHNRTNDTKSACVFAFQCIAQMRTILSALSRPANIVDKTPSPATLEIAVDQRLSK